MNVIKLSAIPSTNTFLRALCLEKDLKDFTIVLAENQTNGKGQRGAVWSSKTGKNLTFSVYKSMTSIVGVDAFYLNIACALAIVRALKQFNIPKLSVKWPNDILSENKKICGILVENVIKHQKVDSSVLGIGLNVNQNVFPDLPKASSLKAITGIHFELNSILEAVITELKHVFLKLENGERSTLKVAYEAVLFRKNKPSTFKIPDGRLFSGYIKGVTEQGRLQVLVENDVVQTFDLKSISLLY